MNSNTLFFLIVAIAILLLIGVFWLGHEIAARRSRAKEQRLENDIIELDDRLNRFNDSMEKDPQRAWINHGQKYVIQRVNRTLTNITDEMGDD